MRRRLLTKEIPIATRSLLLRQGEQCALCKQKLTLATACLDHDHKTGLIRGVLCRNCNGIEGKIHNLVTRARRGAAHKDWLGALILYWIHHETDRTRLFHPTHKDEDEKREARNKKARQRRAKAKLART